MPARAIETRIAEALPLTVARAAETTHHTTSALARTADAETTTASPLPLARAIDGTPRTPDAQLHTELPVARIVDPAPPSTPDPPPVPAPAPAPAVTTVVQRDPDPVPAPAPVAAPPPQPETEELVKKLFDPLLRRLKTELRLDRERRGALTDRPH
ncbi:hypothetical protein [Amycolatopsis sp. NPDC003861]